MIDVGTNSVKFVVSERGADGAWRTVVDRAEVTRLGEGLGDTGRLGAEPVDRTVSVIEAMVGEAGASTRPRSTAVGTAGMRIAENSDELVDAVEERTGAAHRRSSRATRRRGWPTWP